MLSQYITQSISPIETSLASANPRYGANTKYRNGGCYYIHPTAYNVLSLYHQGHNRQVEYLVGGSNKQESMVQEQYGKTEYVSSANAIPDASIADYVKCFKDTLDSALEDSTDAQRKLLALDGGGVRLELFVKIRVLRLTWVATYTFDLESVSVERIDVLESKLRDQQELLEKLYTQQEELVKLRGELKGCNAPPFIKLTASKKRGDLNLRWNTMVSDEFDSSGLDGVVKTLRDGVYNISAIVNVIPESSQYVKLLKNGSPFQVVYPGYAKGFHSSASLNSTEHLEKNDELKVTSACDLSKTPSYLTIVRLGN